MNMTTTTASTTTTTWDTTSTATDTATTDATTTRGVNFQCTLVRCPYTPVYNRLH